MLRVSEKFRIKATKMFGVTEISDVYNLKDSIIYISQILRTRVYLCQ